MRESAPSQKCLAARRVSRTALEVATTATMLIRFRVAINIIGETRVDAWLVLLALRFDFGGVFFARIAFPEKKWRVRTAWRPDFDASLPRFAPRSAGHHVMGSAVKA
jgi:hypothetical protein